MSVLNRLASVLERGDEIPNQELAKEIAKTENQTDIGELVDNLANPDRAIQNDCIKVLYEIADLKPALIAPYVDTFISLLESRNNRLVWGAMTALGAIAPQRAADIGKQLTVIIETVRGGSVITQDWGIRVLATVSAQAPIYQKQILPFLKSFLQTCPPKDLARHAESCVVTVTAANPGELIPILEARKPSLKPAQIRRVEQIIRKMNALS